jgi:hypothetical protein
MGCDGNPFADLLLAFARPFGVRVIFVPERLT